VFLLISSYIADLIFGDPEWFPHPVRGIGKLIELLDKILNKEETRWIGRIKGIILAFIVIGISGFLAYLFITIARKINPILGTLAGVYLGYTALSIKDLFIKAKAIFEKLLKADSLAEARIKLSQIVGRDTQNLSEDKIVKATIESIAESTNDGIIAPLFYLILGGPVLAIIYKAINTLDSMVGYKNERYIHFGWFSAKLDDIANFFPGRITGFLIIAASFILRKNFKDSFKIMLRDGRKHPSVNSGISEAALAGALGIRLGGPSTYHGELEDKPYIGEDKVAPRPLLINEALAISFAVSLLMVLLGILIKWVI
jgi:adenosylcobinamide-phosphate synthase